jgi:DNA polymerase-3 subunit delta
VFIVKDILGKLTEKEEIELVEALPKDNETLLIFTELKTPKGKIPSEIKKSGTVLALEKPKTVNLVKYIKEKVAAEASDIAPLAAERLSTFVGNDLWKLDSEIEKLVLYKKGTDEPIETADVDLLVKSNFDANIFNLMDAIAAKNTARSLELLSSFLESGENGIYIFTMIWRGYRNIALAKFEDKITEQGLAKKAGLHPFVASKAIRQAKNFSKEELLSIYQKLVETDFALKSGAEPEQALQRLLI